MAGHTTTTTREVDAGERDAIEALIDRTSLAAVLRALVEVAAGKAEHVAAHWQDERLSRQWSNAAGYLDRAAGRVTV